MVASGLVFAACCSQGTETVFSKYGLYFEHPPGARLSEQGLYGATADKYSGQVIWRVGDDVFSIAWERSESWSQELADLRIDNAFSNLELALEELEELEELELIDGKVTSEMSGFEVTYQLFELTAEGEKYNGIYAVWYCEPSARVLDAVFMVSGIPMPYFMDFLYTFRCQ